MVTKIWTTTTEQWASLEAVFLQSTAEKYVDNTGTWPSQQKKKTKTNKWCRCTPNSGCSFSSPSFNYTTFQTRLLRTQKQGKGCLIRLERCHLCSRGKAFILFLWDTSRLLKGGIFLLTQYRTPRFYFVVHVWCGLKNVGWVTKKTNKILWIINSPESIISTVRFITFIIHIKDTSKKEGRCLWIPEVTHLCWFQCSSIYINDQIMYVAFHITVTYCMWWDIYIYITKCLIDEGHSTWLEVPG